MQTTYSSSIILWGKIHVFCRGHEWNIASEKLLYITRYSYFKSYTATLRKSMCSGSRKQHLQSAHPYKTYWCSLSLRERTSQYWLSSCTIPTIAPIYSTNHSVLHHIAKRYAYSRLGGVVGIKQDRCHLTNQLYFISYIYIYIYYSYIVLLANSISWPIILINTISSML